MLTAGHHVAKNLLLYRYKQLGKAIENAAKLGFTDGAALYPMVTMNGEECHNEWEITFEEIHRNGAIAYAIFNYINHTGDEAYLKEGGLEVLLGISRFWSQRINWSNDKNKFVMLGVTGPNEYENNVNNNWYTNYIARWTMQYTLEAIDKVKGDSGFWNAFTAKTSFRGSDETPRWKEIIEKLYLPQIEDSHIRLQQDGFLDKEQVTVDHLKKSERPINQHWSWDRILRSVFIKQADVLQGMYFFEDHFSDEEIRENFLYYESRTVHESSLSPCVHSVLASKLGMDEKAYEMYLRTARLDLDDYNHEADEGLHITSMAGTWIAVIEGFGGKRIVDGKLSLNPMLPKMWKAYKFNLVYRDIIISITVHSEHVEVVSRSQTAIELSIYNQQYTVEAGQTLSVKR
jgi:maltose phosphorylase